MSQQQPDSDPGDEDDGERQPVDVVYALLVERFSRLGVSIESMNETIAAIMAGCSGQGVICFGDRHDFACPAGAQ